MVYKGNETPYAQAQGTEKKKMPDSVRENILSGMDVNQSVSDCIIDYAEYSTIIKMARRVMNNSELTNDQKYLVVKSMIGAPI